MFAEIYSPAKHNIPGAFKFEPELRSYMVPGLTTNGYPDYRWESDFALRCVTEYVKPPSKILDAGGGNGVLQIALQKRGYEVHNADRAANIVQMVTAINAKFKTNVQPQQCDLGKTPYGDKTFDCIVSVSSLEHNMPEAFANTIKEMVRVLKPGGCMVLTIPVALTDQQTWDSRVYALWRWSSEALHKALSLPDLTGLPNFALSVGQATPIARHYGVHRLIYPVGFFLRRTGW